LNAPWFDVFSLPLVSPLTRKTNLQFGPLLFLALIVVSLTVVYFGLRGLADRRAGAVHQAEIHTQNLAQALDMSLSATIRQIDQSLLTVIAELECSQAIGHQDPARLRQVIEIQERLLSGAVAIRVTDAEGSLIIRHPNEKALTHLQDCPFWVPLREDAQANLFISDPLLDPFTKQWVIAIARRYSLPGGRFGGVVVIPVLIDRLQKVLSGFQIGEGGTLTLRNSEGGFVTRHPVMVSGRALSIGDKEVSDELRSILGSGIQQKSYFAVTRFDQTKRIHSFRRMKSLPLVVVASMTESDYLSQWRIDQRKTLIRIGAAILGFWIFAGVIWRLGQAHDQAKLKMLESVRESETDYRNLFEMANDAILVFEPEEEIILAVNQSACAIYGFDRDELIGMDLKKLTKDISLGRKRIQELAGSTSNHIFETIQFNKRNEEIHFQINSSVITFQGKRAILSLNRDITERKKTKEALAAQSTALAAVIDNNPLSIQILDSEGRTVRTNPAFLKLFGAIPPPDYCMFTDPTLAAQGLTSLFDRIRAGEVVYFPETSYNVHDLFPENPDCPVWVRAIGFPILGADKLPERFVLVHEDVSLRRKAEQALRESEQQFRSYVDNSPFGIFICDETGRLLQVNPAATVITGYTREELLTLSFHALIPPEALELVMNSFRHLIETGQIKGEFAFKRKNGQVGMMAADGVRLSSTRFMAMIVDVSDRVRIEKEAQQKERYQRALLDNFPFAVWLKDPESRFLSVNQGFAKIFGMNSPEDAVGKTDFDIAPTELAEAYRADDRMVMSMRQNNVTEEEILTDGIRKWFETYKAPVLDNNGELLGTVGFARDITQQKQAEELKAKFQAQLRQSQKMESLGTLAGGVAHDMNNVLGAILGLASGNIVSQPEGTPTHRAFKTIIRAAERGGKMVKGLLTFARQSPTEIHELDVNAILLEEVRLLERTTLSKVYLKTEFASDLRMMRGDASSLSHAFMNLCVNAVDAMPGSGTLTLQTKNWGQDWIEVVVQDTGIGMTPEILEKAMDPFFTTKEVGKGTGLGLSMVYQAVKLHQGEIDIQSAVGQGTRVAMRFPASLDSARAPEPLATEKTVKSCQALTILVVDDDELIQSTTQALLEILGHTVVITGCGEDSLAKLEAGYEPDLVILDMNMPGLGGAGTLPRIRSLRPTLPILLATGRVDQFASDLAGAHPHVTLLSKPYSMAELRQYLEALGAK